MPLDASLVGRTYPPAPPYEVGREKVREFALALGDTDAAYSDAAAAQALGHAEAIAPPTFATVFSIRAAEQLLTDDEVGVDYSRVVHGEERYVFTRPIRVGDVLVATVTVAGIRSMGGHDMVTLRTDVDTVDGERVVTATSMLVVRGEA